VRQLIEDFEDLDEVNKQLEQMWVIATRLRSALVAALKRARRLVAMRSARRSWQRHL
jgi:hypothetical protein